MRTIGIAPEQSNRRLPRPDQERRGQRVFDILGRVRRTRVVLAGAHRDHDTSNDADASLAAFCRRRHMIHDSPEHQRRRWRTLFWRKALGDLIGVPYA